MAGLFDNIQNETRKAARRCAVATVADELDAEDRAAFLAVARDRSVPAPAVRDRLVSAGHPIAKEALWRHRRGDCKCD